MAGDYSFDVVSKVDLQSIDDGVNTANKEMTVRFDFRGSVSRMEFDKEKAEIVLYSDDEGKLKSVVEIFQMLSEKHESLLREFAETENHDVMPESRGFWDKIKDYLG